MLSRSVFISEITEKFQRTDTQSKKETAEKALEEQARMREVGKHQKPGGGGRPWRAQDKGRHQTQPSFQSSVSLALDAVSYNIVEGTKEIPGGGELGKREELKEETGR